MNDFNQANSNQVFYTFSNLFLNISLDHYSIDIGYCKNKNLSFLKLVISSQVYVAWIGLSYWLKPSGQWIKWYNIQFFSFKSNSIRILTQNSTIDDIK